MVKTPKEKKGKEYYIFIAADTDPRMTKPSAYQVALHRLGKKMWGLGYSTPSRSSIKTGDEALIYVSGNREHRLNFIAQAKIESAPRETPTSLIDEINAPQQTGIAPSDYFVKLKAIEKFKKFVDIKLIKNKLLFIKRPSSKKWGCYLQGGVKRISKRDFSFIVGRS